MRKMRVRRREQYREVAPRRANSYWDIDELPHQTLRLSESWNSLSEQEQKAYLARAEAYIQTVRFTSF
jgi:hypothetical protein